MTDHLDFLQTGWTHQMGSGSRLGAIADVLNVANGPQKSEVAIQEPRSARLQLRYEF